MKKPKILLIEDEAAIARGLIDVLIFHGYDVAWSDDGSEGLRRAGSEVFDLLIVDVMLPGIDGFSICNTIRAQDREQPIIMLTAKTSDEDIIHGLSLGADDYVGKPFSLQELLLRIEAVLRRSRRTVQSQARLSLGPHLSLDIQTLSGTANWSGTDIALQFTRREVEILQYLFANRERPVSRGELLEQVWGYRRAANVDTRTVDIHVAKLRRKIEQDPKAPALLVTVRGEGYQLLLAEARV